MYKEHNKGMITVELLLAFFLWAIFLSGIVSLWFGLFGPRIPFFVYLEQERFFVSSMKGGVVLGGTEYVDRDIQIIKNQNGLVGLHTDWQNGIGKEVCRGLDTNQLQDVITSPLKLDGANVATAMAVRGKYIYMTTNSSSTTEPDLYVISLPNLSIVSKIDNGPGLSDISVAGYSAYVANTSINSQAQAIDITDPVDLRIKWSFKVPGSQGTSTALGKAIFTDGGKVFLGTAKNASSELFSIDAQTGHLLAEHEMSVGVNNLFADKDGTDSMLYVTTPVDPELKVFNVLETEMNLISGYDAPGGSGNGKSIEIFNGDVYLGRTLGGNELVKLHNLAKQDDVKIGATVDAVIASKNFLYILTGHPQKELQVWKTGEELSLSQIIDLPARGVDIGCSGNYLYILLGTNIPLLVFEAKK